MISKTSTIIVILSLFTTSYATCACRSYIKNSWGTYGCDDVELTKECERAEFELVDWVNSVMAYARTYVQAHPTTAEADSSNMAHLSYAVEINRPVPDCATGSFTTTRLDDTDYQCYSPDLLEQCEYVKNNVYSYIDDVIHQLTLRNASDDFIAVIEKRVIESIIPTITCQTTEDVENSASTLMITGITLLLPLMLII